MKFIAAHLDKLWLQVIFMDPSDDEIDQNIIFSKLTRNNYLKKQQFVK